MVLMNVLLLLDRKLILTIRFFFEKVKKNCSANEKNILELLLANNVKSLNETISEVTPMSWRKPFVNFEISDNIVYR